MYAGLANIRAPLLYADAHQSDKNAVLEPYLWSKLFHNAGTWNELRAPQLRKLNGAYLKALSAAAAVKYINGEPSIAQWQVHRATGQPPATAWLTVMRLRYLQRLLAHAPAPLLWLLDADRTWINAVAADMTKLQRALRQLEELPPPEDDLRAWLRFIKEHPGPWRKMLKLYRERAAKSAADADASPSQEMPDREENAAWHGYLCGSAFDTRVGLAAHAKWAHKVRPAYTEAIHGTSCLACMKLVHTRARLATHLAVGSIACTAAVIDNVEPPDEISKQMLEAEERARAAAYRAAPGKHHPCHMPMRRLFGPLPKWAPRSYQANPHDWEQPSEERLP